MNKFKFADLFFRIQQHIKMSFSGLRLKYDLEGNSYYIAWKEMMEAVLEDNGLKVFVDTDIPKPAVVDAQLLDASQKKVANARRMLLEGV